MEDAMVPDVPVNPDPELPYIDGPQFVNVYDESLVYTIQNLAGGKFVVNSSLIKINETSETSISLDILTGKSGAFTIHYVTETEDIELNVEIKSF